MGDFRYLNSNYLLISARRGLAGSDIITSRFTMEKRQRYQFHCALLLDVTLFEYRDDDSNLRAAPHL
jgi:hypothetical protein